MIDIINDSMIYLLEYIEPNSIDSIVTDPPYELNFMGKGWDNAGVSFNKETWKRCFDVLKPGGYLLAFGGSRTFHRIACAIEDAGFEIRDTIMWLYGSGFPKSMNIGLTIDKKNGIDVKSSYVPNNKNNLYGKGLGGGKTDITLQATNEWQGWGTCLKPAFEPIIVARKPFKGSLVDNVLEYGVGGINIDECRVDAPDKTLIKFRTYDKSKFGGTEGNGIKGMCKTPVDDTPSRFPANVILDNTFTEEWSRYFYCAKASKKDRDNGLDNFEEKTSGELTERKENSVGISPYAGSRVPKKNIHPTVKPTSLMQYLVRLVTPKGGTILDPFMGSGSTGKAVVYENKERNAKYNFIGIEVNEEYCDIAEARIKGAV